MVRVAPPVDEDRELVRRARGGEYEAFGRLVSKYERRVYTRALRIVGREADAEDVVQETFLSVVEHLGAFREESAFAGWLLRIAANHALKLLRKRRGLSTVPLREEGEGEGFERPAYIARWREEPERLAERPEVKRLLAEALDELDEKHREVFVLRDVEGLSTEEAAAALGITSGNVKVRLLRARLRLRERLTRVLGDEATRMVPPPDHDHGPVTRRESGDRKG